MRFLLTTYLRGRQPVSRYNETFGVDIGVLRSFRNSIKSMLSRTTFTFVLVDQGLAFLNVNYLFHLKNVLMY